MEARRANVLNGHGKPADRSMVQQDAGEKLEIRINPDFQRLLKPLSPNRYESLKKSIKEHGLFHAIVVNKQGYILDGHNRFKICKELGIAPSYVVKEFPDKLSEELFILESHIERRQLSDFEIIELAKPLIGIERKLAEQRFKKHLPKKGQKDFQPVLGSKEHDTGRTHERVAEKLGLSPATIKRSLKIIEAAPEELKQDIREGHMSVSRAYNKITRKESSFEEKGKVRMYAEALRFPSFFVGCKYACKYCIPSFQQQMKRLKHSCKQCYDYVPHFHPERMRTVPPKTGPKEFVFLCDFGDISFAPPAVIYAIIGFCLNFPDTNFLIQSKNPGSFKNYTFPANVSLGTTIETNRDKVAAKFSTAPPPSARFKAMLELKHPKKVITVEPILEFDLDVLVRWIRTIKPSVVYVGYDSHPKQNKLDEPPLELTNKLVTRIREFAEVRTKEMREAWNAQKTK